MGRPRRAATGAVIAVLATTLVACGEMRPSPSGSQVVSSSDEPSSPATADLPFDAASRDLLAVMAADDPVSVVVGTAWTGEMRAAAIDAGLDSELFDPASSLVVDGPLHEVLDVVRGFPVSAVQIRPSDDPMRAIPEARPAVEVPVPGRPYEVTGFAGDPGAVRIEPPAREALMRSLTSFAWTVDGRPYARIDLSGGCDANKTGPECRVTLVGWSPGTGDFEDDLSIVGRAVTGFAGAIEPGGVRRTSVPWRLVRFAEWTARHDEAALAKIRTYTWCCIPTWDPARRGVIGLEYERPCDESVVMVRKLADTGECFDRLIVTVDVGSGAVAGLEEHDGP